MAKGAGSDIPLLISPTYVKIHMYMMTELVNKGIHNDYSAFCIKSKALRWENDCNPSVLMCLTDPCASEISCKASATYKWKIEPDNSFVFLFYLHITLFCWQILSEMQTTNEYWIACGYWEVSFFSNILMCPVVQAHMTDWQPKDWFILLHRQCALCCCEHRYTVLQEGESAVLVWPRREMDKEKHCRYFHISSSGIHDLAHRLHSFISHHSMPVDINQTGDRSQSIRFQESQL